MCPLHSIVRSGAVLVVLLSVSAAQLSGSIKLDPKTYRSPSGEYLLLVDPTRPTGGGSGQYRFTYRGTELWSGSRPWTLWDAEVTDDGLVAGYAYGAGIEGGSGDALTIVLMDKSGKSRLEERSKREGEHSCMSGPEPMVNGLFVDRANERLIVRIRGAWGRLDSDSPETWWTYGLTNGEAGPRLSPRRHMPKDERVGSILAARPVPGTGLVMLHWAWLDFDVDQLGSVFTLLDRDGEVRWRLDWPSDCCIPGDDSAQDSLWQEMREQGAILSAEAGSFSVRKAATKERVTFEVRQVPGSREGLEVREIARAPYEPRKTIQPGGAGKGKVRPLPALELQHLGTIVLGDERAGPPIHDVMAFGLDGRGRLGVICRSDPRFDFLLVDADGTVMSTTELPRPPEKKWWVFETAWVGGDRWVVTGSTSGIGEGAAGFWLEPLARGVTPIESFDCPSVEALAGTGDGGFVALGKLYFRYSMAPLLVAFDARGARRWTLGGEQGDPQEPSSLFSPESVTVTSDGRVVVLDNIQDFLQFFSSEGGFLRALELKEPWDRDPNYPTGIRPDLDGGVIVHDFNGQPPIVRMDREDRVTAAFQPRFADGKLFRIRSDMQVAGDGSLWTSDGESLLLLDRTGVVQRVLGSVPEADVLGRVARLVLGPADHLYAADRRTGCVHVFDATGERLRVCRPRPEDFDGELSLPSLTVNDAGEVFLAEDGSMGFVRFDPSGERHGIARLALDQVSQDWYAQPGTGRTWVVGYEALFLVESDRSVVRSIVRAPDGTWLREMGPAGVAPDGSIVLATGREWNGSPLRLHVFSAVGDPVRSLDLPPGTATWSPFAFDGKQLAFSVQDPATRASSLVLLDLGTQELRRIAVERSDVLWTPAFAAGGHELWLFDGARRVERYRLE